VVNFRDVIEPLLRQPGVEFIGEINEQAKADFLGNAAALLFPVDWPEPFGLVLIEAMACGTPVVAFDCGSVPEIVEDGLTGHIVSTVEEAVHCLPNAVRLDRRTIRRRFEERFSASRMANDYVTLYRTLVKKHLSYPLNGFRSAPPAHGRSGNVRADIETLHIPRDMDRS
jgi:glycosyltransferase involved in cell wall biosynthesis